MAFPHVTVAILPGKNQEEGAEGKKNMRKSVRGHCYTSMTGGPLRSSEDFYHGKLQENEGGRKMGAA